MSLDTSLKTIKETLQQEREAGRSSGFSQIAASRARRETLNQQWQMIQTELATLDQQIKDLPALPPQEQIAWAQAVLAMHDLAFLELDTTGLDAQDEIIRFTLIDRSLNTIEDFLIKPKTSRLSEGASRANGIQTEQLEREGIPLAEAWERMRVALSGRYIISYSQGWDLQQLKKTATTHQLEPLVVIGDDLQPHTFQYYHREYNLTLAALCERIGHPLPPHPHQTSLDRAKGQVYVMAAIANAITDVRQAKAAISIDTDFDTDGPEDLSDHPF